MDPLQALLECAGEMEIARANQRRAAADLELAVLGEMDQADDFRRLWIEVCRAS